MGFSMVAAALFPRCAFILGLLMPTGTLAAPLIDSGARCTHWIGLDQTTQVRIPQAAGLNAIQDARNFFIDRFGKPTFEKQVSNGADITWVIGGNSNAIARSVDIQIVQGAVHVTCGTAF